MSSGAQNRETDAPLHGPDHRERTAVAGALVTAVVTLCFLLIFWNRFLGLRSGEGGFTGGLYLLRGILPYRDYYSAVPPLFVARCAAVLAIFGRLPIVLRAFSVFERVLLALLLYGWLVRLFRVKDAAWAAIVTIVVCSGDHADPLSSYNHFTIMLAVASGFAASHAFEEGRTKRFVTTAACVSGVFSLLCIATKQTIGLGVTVAIPVFGALCLHRLDGYRRAVRFLAGYAAGWLVAAGTLVAWMTHSGILRAFLTQTFVTGPSAKAAHPGDFVVRTLMVLQDYWWAALIGSALLLLLGGALRRSDCKAKVDGSRTSLVGLLLALLLGLCSIGAATLIHSPAGRFSPDMAAKPTIYTSLLGSGLLLVYYSWRFLSGKLARRQFQFALLALIGFIVAFMTSLSFPAFEAMTIPGLGLILAVLLNDFEGWRRWMVYAVCGMLLFCETLAKERIPFSFDGWFEPRVRVATVASSLPELRGFLLPRNTVDFVDSTVRIIQENSSPQDTMFIYPELGWFYGLTGRTSATFSASHNIDFVPDSLAKTEAQRLLRARPAVLIYGPQPEGLLRGDELLWRNGRRSGQREIIAAVETLARQYTLVQEYNLYPFGAPVYVFVRPDKAGAAH